MTADQANAVPITDALLATLRSREAYRDRYWRERDPIADDRLLWRAQSVRHTVHLLPGQTILELGGGEGRFTRALLKVTRGENPITVLSFTTTPAPAQEGVEQVSASGFPGVLAGRQFDCIVAMDLLDREIAPDLLQVVFDLLAPGGEAIFYESNPWNPVLNLRRALGALSGRKDPRRLLARSRLYELVSEIGFVRVYSVYNDFVYAPLTRSLVWWFKNLSILFENAPLVSRLAGSILLHAQKPPRRRPESAQPLPVHPSLRGAVSVVVPCRNEEMNVGGLVTRLLELYGGYVHEIIVLDDGSADGTREAMRALAAQDARVRPIFREAPHGVGRAIAEGLRAATGRYVLTIDCDFQHLLPEFRDLFDAAASGYDVVMGSRFSRHSVLLNYPFMKIVANRGFHTLARWLLGCAFRDVTNNLKLIRREVVDDLVLRQPGFAVNAETGIQPWLLGYKVREIPISWINRTPGMGTSSFRLVRVGGGYWQVLAGLWRRRWLGSGPYRDLRRGRGAQLRVMPATESALT
ncbi:MAG TPA: glycosyltransferase [Opitutus sp.]|nr:glycosyltransferase [Opitutus sp.]